MGSPVSAVIANLVMEDVEQRALASVPVSLSFWKRFVDDVISAVSRNEIDIIIIIIITKLPAPKRAFQQVITNHLYATNNIYTPTNIHTYIQTQIKIL